MTATPKTTLSRHGKQARRRFSGIVPFKRRRTANKRLFGQANTKFGRDNEPRQLNKFLEVKNAKWRIG